MKQYQKITKNTKKTESYNYRSTIFQTVGNLFAFLSLLIFCQTLTAQNPRVFLLNAGNLAETKQKIAAGDKEFGPALGKLKSDADKALKSENFSITDKEGTPPSGDKHDYMSQAPYFWKNPNTPNGLPYIRRDGERNPEIKRFPDHDTLDNMADAVQTLALAYYFTNNEAYADKATELLRVYFLAAATKMNPNMEYAQAVPGESTGRNFGVLESRALTRVVDAVGLLGGSKSWTKADQAGLEDWFANFVKWLTESKNGRGEAASPNNHGTFYDVQLVSYALFIHNNALAKSTLETAKQKRIAKQIEPDGRQPLELDRTKSWNYSTMNLDGLMLLADLGTSAGVDLWNYQTPDGRSLRRAVDYLYPFAVGDKKWETQQIEGWEPQRLFPLMTRAAAHYSDEKFQTMLSKVPATKPTDKNYLLAAHVR